MKYPYLPYRVSPSPAEPGVKMAYRPTVPVRIIGLGGSIKLRGILDTSADETVLPAYLLQRIQVATRSEDVSALGGAGGRPFVVTYGTVDFEVQLDEDAPRWHAKVAFDPHRRVPLLGQVGFLRFFTVTFDDPGDSSRWMPPARFPPRSCRSGEGAMLARSPRGIS